ncbi:MAG: UDP-N-acetylmuramoyl-L-alanyl-D-glutamate--2,6-diaminopimelate ligase [Bacillota bacterium]
MRLADLLPAVDAQLVAGSPDTEINGITNRSGDVAPGFLFVAWQGMEHDGHDYIPEALRRGAVAVVVERDIAIPKGVAVVRVADGRASLPLLVAHFYGDPSHELRVVGITGTSGKTTTAFLTEAVFNQTGHRTGLIGTIWVKIGDQITVAEATTPEATDLQRIFAQMVQVQTEYVIMEVSSHALELRRVDETRFTVGVFTNISHEHLDFHKTFDNYIKAKRKLFEQMSDDTEVPSWAVINTDDPEGAKLAAELSIPVIRFGLSESADLYASRIRVSPQGTTFIVHYRGESCLMKLKLIGRVNVYNALAATGVALTQGLSLAAIADTLGKVTGVPGRFETVDRGQDFTVVVDYAHKPDALEKVLCTCRELCPGRIITVFGCGGERDTAKRPVMGEIAARHSDLIILTSDNPRREDPLAIAHEISVGCAKVGKEFILILDRAQAIHAAVAQAGAGDLILIAGKGHETYQIFADQIIDFDDREVAQRAIERVLSQKPS